jgi:hypothetical protein
MGMRAVAFALIMSGYARADKLPVGADDDEPLASPPGFAMMMAVEGAGGGIALVALVGELGNADSLPSERVRWPTFAFYASVPLLTVGPSIGHMISGDYAIGAFGIAGNALGGTLMWAAEHRIQVLEHRHPPQYNGDTRAKVELFSGYALFAGCTLFELLDEYRIAKRERDRRIRVTPAGVTLAF